MSINCVSQHDQVAEALSWLALSLGQFLHCTGPSPPCIPALTMSNGKKASTCCSHLRTKHPFLIAETERSPSSSASTETAQCKFLVLLYFKLGGSGGRCHYHAVTTHLLHHTISSNHFPSHVCLGCTLIHLVPTTHSCPLTLNWGVLCCQCHCYTVATNKARKNEYQGKLTSQEHWLLHTERKTFK